MQSEAGAARRGLDTLERFATYVQRSLVPRQYESQERFSREDYFIAAALGLLALAIAAWGAAQFDLRVYEHWNIYFQADPNRALKDITERSASGFHRQGGVHPVFSLLTYPLMHALTALGVAKISAGNLLIVLCAAGSGSGFYLALRGLGLPVHAALAFGGAFLANATFLHWFTIIDTFAFAGLTIVISLLVATRGGTYQLGPCFIASVLTLSVTITNWVMGLAVAFFRLGFRSFVKVTVAAFITVAILACAQKVVFPAARLFFNPRVVTGEAQFLQLSMQKTGVAAWTPISNVRSVLISSAVAPAPSVEDAQTIGGVFRLVNNQFAPMPKLISTEMAAIICWLFLLAMGLWGAWRDTFRRSISAALLSYVAFQLLLYSVYGEITFLYAANFFPALAMLAALGWFTPARQWVLGAAVAFTVFAGFNNHTRFLTAVRLSNEIAANYSASKMLTTPNRPVAQLAPALTPSGADTWIH